MKQQRKQPEALKQHMRASQTVKHNETTKLRQNSEIPIHTTHESNF